MSSAPTVVPDSLSAGHRLGRYEILSRIAVGGMAELYLACARSDAGFAKLVAIKRILPQRTADTDFVQMFLQEAQIASSLDHSNIATVMDFGHDDCGRPYLVMEYLHGMDLLEVLKRPGASGRLDPGVAIAIGLAVCNGLHYAHDRTHHDGRPMGLVHRDISPTNVFVCFNGDVKVLDFGIAKATYLTSATTSGALKGKLAYMSPEQCRGGEIDRRSDIHAIGNLLYALTTGRRMYRAPNEYALLNVAADGIFEPPSTVCPGYPPELEAIVLKAAAPRASARYDTAQQLADDLSAFAVARGLNTTPAIVEQHMRAHFGEVAYPTIPDYPGGRASTGDARKLKAWLRPASGLIAVVAALGVGMAIGGWRDGQDEDVPRAGPVEPPPMARSAAVRGSAPEASAPVPEPFVQPPPSESESESESESKSESESEQPVASEAHPTPAADPEPRAEVKPSARKKPKPRRKHRKRTAAQPEAKPAGHGGLFLPPSMRGG